MPHPETKFGQLFACEKPMQVVHAGDIRCELSVMSLIVRSEPEEEAIAMAHSDQLKGMMLFQFNPHLGRCNVNMFQLFYGKMASSHLRENGFKPATTTCIGKKHHFFSYRAVVGGSMF